ncbi:MAG: mechanosensitive ion channel family protein [Caldilineales bacterium]|nr:mechanosensitive ion channel family protein [Caldilineales bacterium]
MNPQPTPRYQNTLVLIAAVIAAIWFVGSAIGNGIRLQAQDGGPIPTSTPAVATPLPGVPVEVGGKVIFYVRARLGSLTPVERAQLIQERISHLANDPFGTPVDLRTVESPDGIDIMNGDDVILTVTERDVAAANFNEDIRVVTDKVRQVIQEEVMRTRAQNTPRARLTRLGESLAFLIVLIIVFYFINRLYHSLIRRIDAVSTETAGERVWESSRFYRSGAWKRIVKLGLNLIRIILFLLLLFFIVPLALRLFPSTAKLANKLFELFLTPITALWDWFNAYQSNLITIGVIILIIYLMIRTVRWFFTEIAEGNIRISGFDPDWASFTGKMISFLLIVAGVVIAFPYLPGSDSEAFRGVSVFLGLLFTLSSTAAVTNIVAGIIQTYTGAFRVGDVVKIGDTSGIVTEKRLLTTRVRTFKNEEVSIPNGSVLNTNVTNYTTLAAEGRLILYTTITIGYDAPWKDVQAALIRAAERVPDVLPEPAPFVLQTSLNDFHISYQLNCYTASAERMMRVYSALHQNIQDTFNEAGIEILSPGFTALRDGNTVTIPESYRPDDYAAPAFRVTQITGRE